MRKKNDDNILIYTEEDKITDKSNNENVDNPEKLTLWRSCRLFVAILGALVMSMSIASQASMTSAMVCMLKDDDEDNILSHHRQKRNSGNPDSNSIFLKNDTAFDVVTSGNESGNEAWKFSWDSQTQGWVVSSFFFGYFFMQIPSGIIVTRLGPKGVMTFGLITTGILHLLSIPTAIWSLPVLYTVRTVAGLTCGFMYSGIFALVANWCPRQETSVMFALPCLGSEFGNSFIFLVALFGCELDFQRGWPVVFYVLGISQVLVGLVMLFGVTDFPTNNRFISQQEAKYITKYRVHEDKAREIPYCRILRSLPVWAFLMGQFATEYAYYTIMTQGPVFLRDILKLSHWKINTVSSVPFLIATPTAFVVGYVSDKLVAKRWISTTCMRKSNEAISKILLAVSLGVLAVLPVDEFVSAFCIFLAGGIGIQFCYIGFMANPGDLSPAHAGFLAGLGQALTSWVSFVIPVITGNLTSESEKTRGGWFVILFVAVGLQVFCLLFSLLFGSGNLQPWAKGEVNENYPMIDKNKNGEKTGKTSFRYRTLSE